MWLLNSCPPPDTQISSLAVPGVGVTSHNTPTPNLKKYMRVTRGKIEVFWEKLRCGRAAAVNYPALSPGGEWLHHGCKIPIMDSQGQRDCPARLLQTASEWRGGQDSRATKQLCKHRWVPGAVGLIRDGRWRLLGWKGHGMISVGELGTTRHSRTGRWREHRLVFNYVLST